MWATFRMAQQSIAQAAHGNELSIVWGSGLKVQGLEFRRYYRGLNNYQFPYYKYSIMGPKTLF